MNLTPTDEQPTPISRAERRRAARQSADEQNPEAVPDENEAAEDPEARTTAISDVVREYGNVVADLSRERKIPHAQGVRIVELVLQYDVNRRNLALQEASLMQNMAFPPPGAHPVTPEEADQIQDGSHPDLQQSEE